MIRIEALPASDGDCLWVEWSEPSGAHGRMIVDGGRGNTLRKRFGELAPDKRFVDLMVCTHIDIDHIGGLIELLTDPPEGFAVGEFWFNGRRHLREDLAGPRQGEQLELLLDRMPVRWNAAFGGGAVVVSDAGPLPTARLGSLAITLVAPGRRELARLDATWLEAITEPIEPLRDRPLPPGESPIPLADLVDLPHLPDTGAANGSSIAFIAEHDDGGRILFAADAPAETLLPGLRRFVPELPVRIDLCKVPHHGSARNVSRELVAALDCRNWLFSTSGARHGHPHRAAVARIVAAAPNQVLWFNYHSLTTEEYASTATAQPYRFDAVHPNPVLPGMALRVSGDGVERVG